MAASMPSVKKLHKLVADPQAWGHSADARLLTPKFRSHLLRSHVTSALKIVDSAF